MNSNASELSMIFSLIDVATCKWPVDNYYSEYAILHRFIIYSGISQFTMVVQFFISWAIFLHLSVNRNSSMDDV